MESLWKDPRQFRVEELRRSEINKMHKEDKQLFISHCWRKTFDPEDPQSEDVQGRKRQIISHLSCPVKASSIAPSIAAASIPMP